MSLVSERTAGYAFASDGKSYRTQPQTPLGSEKKRIEVQEGRRQPETVVKTLMTTVEVAMKSIEFSDDGRRLFTINDKGVATAYAGDGGKPLWTATPELQPESPAPPIGRNSMLYFIAASPKGKIVLAVR